MTKIIKQINDNPSNVSIRKLTIGTCSLLLGTVLFGSQQTHAQELDNDSTAITEPIIAIEEELDDASNRIDQVHQDLALSNVEKREVREEDSIEEMKEYLLTYNAPAANTYAGWEDQALPVGNGAMGNKVFGLVGEERIQYNEKTLWSGGPTPDSTTYNGGNIENKHEIIPQIQAALEAGDVTTAKHLAETHLVGPYTEEYGRYLSFGDIEIDFTNQSKELSETTNYQRSLDLNTAITDVSYTQGNTHYKRETFISYPDNVSVTHLTREGESLMDFDLSMKMTTDLRSSQQTSAYKEGTVTYSEEGILLKGIVKNNLMNFASFLNVNTDGQVSVLENKLRVVGASYATLIMNAQTDYAQNPKTNYRKTDFDVETSVKEVVKSAAEKGYEAIKSDHIEDYQSIFHRVKLNLTDERSGKTTDELLRTYQKENGQELEELFYQFGRYLLITSSRDAENALPANLQGVWNAVDDPAWHSDYHLNVNLQMNYWPAYSANMAEMAIPLINFVDDLRYYGRVAAAEYGNVKSEEGEENGWLVHTQVTPFGWTTPGWDYYWGWSPAANAWIMQNVYDYYKFTQDKAYLNDKIYPMLKETAKFWNQFLHYDAQSDRWVSSPSYSPEHGSISIGNTFDQSLVWQLFHDFKEATAALEGYQNFEVDKALLAEIEEKFNKLSPLHINRAGRIKEWYEEDTPAFTGEKVDPHHRHISELVGLFPGTLFSKDQPELLAAARATLDGRGDGGTGWSKANKINLWARILDGNRAHTLLSEQLMNSTLNNLWDTHPPFQIDGNFGATSGMTEMLLQSHTGYIAPLAALPDAWSNGSVSGLMARGNYEVDMAWKDKSLTQLNLTANVGGTLQIDYPGIHAAKVMINGEVVEYKVIQEGRIEIATNQADQIAITDILKRVSNIHLNRTNTHEATLSFDPVENATKYLIERKNVTTNETSTYTVLTNQFIDRNAVNSNEYEYTVRALVQDDLTPVSESKTINAFLTIFDDRDPNINYGAAFGDWPDSSLYAGTEKFAEVYRNLNMPIEHRTVTVPFFGKGIEIYGLKHSGLGTATAKINGEVVGKLDFYHSQLEKSVLIGRIEGLDEGMHTLEIVVDTEIQGRPGELQKVSLDYFKVLSDDVTQPEKLDDRDSRINYGSLYNIYYNPVLYAGTETYVDLYHQSNDILEEHYTTTLNFNGNGIKVYGLKSKQLGAAKVFIDDIELAPLNFYVDGATQEGVLIGEYTNLSNGDHTIRIVVDRSFNGRPKISFDAFEILKKQFEEVKTPIVSDVLSNDDTLSLSLPNSKWDNIEVTIGEHIFNFRKGQNDEIQSIEGVDFVLNLNSQLLMTLPNTIDRSIDQTIKVVAQFESQLSNDTYAILKAAAITQEPKWTQSEDGRSWTYTNERGEVVETLNRDGLRRGESQQYDTIVKIGGDEYYVKPEKYLGKLTINQWAYSPSADAWYLTDATGKIIEKADATGYYINGVQQFDVVKTIGNGKGFQVYYKPENYAGKVTRNQWAYSPSENTWYKTDRSGKIIEVASRDGYYVNGVQKTDIVVRVGNGKGQEVYYQANGRLLVNGQATSPSTNQWYQSNQNGVVVKTSKTPIA